MASCDPVTFSGVNANIFECLKNKLGGLGYSLSGNSGTLRGPMGIVIDYNWNAGEQTLFIQVKDKNFLVPCGKVMSELEKAINQCDRETGGSGTMTA